MSPRDPLRNFTLKTMEQEKIDAAQLFINFYNNSFNIALSSYIALVVVKNSAPF